MAHVYDDPKFYLRNGITLQGWFEAHAKSLGFLGYEIVDSIKKETNLQRKLDDITSSVSNVYLGEINNENRDRAIKAVSDLEHAVKKSYLDQANENVGYALSRLTDNLPTLQDAHRELARAAEVYCALNNHAHYVDTVAQLAVVDYELSGDNAKAKELLRSIDILVNAHLKRTSSDKGKCKDVQQTRRRKERNARVREMKAAGVFEEKQRWPRVKGDLYQNHEGQRGIITALNFLYKKMSALSDVDAQDHFEVDYKRATGIINHRLKNPKLQEAERNRFDALYSFSE